MKNRILSFKQTRELKPSEVASVSGGNALSAFATTSRCTGGCKGQYDSCQDQNK